MSDFRQAPKGLRWDDTLEVHPGSHGWLILDGSNIIGELQIGSGEMSFNWTSSTVAWPSTFTVEAPAGRSAPTTTVADTYEHQTFPASASHDISSCDYKISSGVNVIGWLKLNGSNAEWYGVPAYVSSGYLVVSGGEMTFKANDVSGSQTAHKLVDDVI